MQSTTAARCTLRRAYYILQETLEYETATAYCCPSTSALTRFKNERRQNNYIYSNIFYFDFQNGTFIGPTLTVPMMMFSGFGVRLCDLPTVMNWGSYVSYLRYGLEGVVGAIYGLSRDTIECPEDKFCLYKYPKEFLEMVDVRSDQFDNDMIALFIFLFILRISAFVVLRYKLISVR